MVMSAAYLTPGGGREPWHYRPGSFAARARCRVVGGDALPGTQRAERTDRAKLPQATIFADRLRAAGFTILNDVVLNQVLVSFGSEERNTESDRGCSERRHLLVRRNGMAGHAAMRISVSSWATTDEDVERSAAAMIRIAKQETQ